VKRFKSFYNQPEPEELDEDIVRKIKDTAKGLATGGAIAAGAMGLGLATKGPDSPQTSQVQINDKPNAVAQVKRGNTTLQQGTPTTGVDVAKKVIDKNKPAQATLDDHSDHLHEYEGFRGKVYNDHKGNPTVGYGHMFKSDSKATWDAAGIGHLHDSVKSGKASLPEADARKLLHHELTNTYIPRAQKLVKNYDRLNKDAQVAVVGSVFRGGLPGSPKTLKHLNAGNFKKAGAEFIDNNEYRESKAAGTGVHKRMDFYSNAYGNAHYVR